MLSLRAHALITGGFFAGLLVIGWGANLLEGFGLFPHEPALQIGVLVVLFGLCAGLAFSAVPLIVLTVLRFQVSVGKRESAVHSNADCATTGRSCSSCGACWRPAYCSPCPRRSSTAPSI